MVQARPAPKAAYTPARHLSLARDGWPGRALPWHVADAAPELWCGGWTGPPGLIGIASSTHSWSWLKIFFFGGLPFLVSSCFLCIVSRLLEDRAVLAPLSLLYLSLARSYLDALIEIDSERGRSLSLTHQRLAVVRGVACGSTDLSAGKLKSSLEEPEPGGGGGAVQGRTRPMEMEMETSTSAKDAIAS